MDNITSSVLLLFFTALVHIVQAAPETGEFYRMYVMKTESIIFPQVSAVKARTLILMVSV